MCLTEFDHAHSHNSHTDCRLDAPPVVILVLVALEAPRVGGDGEVRERARVMRSKRGARRSVVVVKKILDSVTCISDRGDC